jgi:hypothetical protein
MNEVKNFRHADGTCRALLYGFPMTGCIGFRESGSTRMIGIPKNRRSPFLCVHCGRDKNCHNVSLQENNK